VVTRNRLGQGAAVAAFAIGLAYAVTLAVGFSVHGLKEPIVDPILAIMEVLTLLSAPPLLILMAAVHDYAAADRKLYGMVALAFAILFAGGTTAVHFVELTARRQTGSAGIVWPSTAYAVELLSWDVFLGLALVFAAAVFDGGRLERRVRGGLLLGGVLCLAGGVGPLVGNMRLQLIGVAGYAGVLPVVCLLLAVLFRHEQGRSRQVR
jgi:hypothetical protein